MPATRLLPVAVAVLAFLSLAGCTTPASDSACATGEGNGELRLHPAMRDPQALAVAMARAAGDEVVSGFRKDSEDLQASTRNGTVEIHYTAQGDYSFNGYRTSSHVPSGGGRSASPSALHALLNRTGFAGTAWSFSEFDHGDVDQGTLAHQMHAGRPLAPYWTLSEAALVRGEGSLRTFIVRHVHEGQPSTPRLDESQAQARADAAVACRFPGHATRWEATGDYQDSGGLKSWTVTADGWGYQFRGNVGECVYFVHVVVDAVTGAVLLIDHPAREPPPCEPRD